LTRQRLLIILQALAAATSHSTNAQAEYLTLEQFIQTHPEEQVFELTVREEKHHAKDRLRTRQRQ
jgi:hypothetical protein